MASLASKTCVPCRGGVLPLKGQDLATLQKQLPEWQVVNEHHIVRQFKFSDFKPTITGAPLLGEHTDDVLAGLGYDADAIAKMHADQVV